MEPFTAHPLLIWIAQHPYWVGIAIFLVSLSESLALVGLFIPGALAMFGIGTLVAAGAVNLWPALAWAVAGAIAGDAVSYWLGRHYREQLQTFWPFSRSPQLIDRGVAFFHRHGGKSVVLGRFVGPMRPIIPAIAGMLGMPPVRFYLANILSALGWAPAYILPGVVFGASLGLAEAVATRLAVTVATLVVAIWGGAWVISRAVLLLQPRIERGLSFLQAWSIAAPSGRDRHLRKLVASLLDPTQPESRTLLILAGLLIVAAWGFFGVLEDVLTRDPLVLIDSSTYHFLQSLRTPFGDAIMIALTELGDAAVTLLVVSAALIWLLAQRAWRPAAYLLAAVGFAAALTVAIKAGLRLPRPTPLYQGINAFSFPSGHATMSIVSYGFLAVLAARELPARGRLAVLTATFLLVILIAFSRLYLGAHWLSDVLAGLAFGTAWLALLGIAYLRHPAPAFSARGLMVVAFSALLVGGGFHVSTRHADDTLRYAVHQNIRFMAQQDWWGGAWQTLPAWRIDIEGEYEQPLTVQWAGSPEYLRRSLLGAGWREPLPLSGRNFLLWLDPSRSAMELPLLPRAHDGRHEGLALIHPVPGQRLVLRLWQTDTVLRETAQPVWVGMVTRETVIHPLSWFSLPRDGRDFNQPRQTLLDSLSGVPARLARRGEIPGPVDEQTIIWDKQVLLAREPEMP
ncbi:PA-phosphatase [Sulfuricella sp. T08]|uniref:bifunctional DedA family/phosphatase PAP2 family protein n=1 Tax=Sulfuricella sp. T08 TaxID=1632857 RepID=UPI0006179A5F|nr:bifunctional DedA family/phosphatase PAP2 family protein [Sulfuricella sp. T08]GAO35504.1 PA-phosphatase [Sulfuricella sp. T08]